MKRALAYLLAITLAEVVTVTVPGRPVLGIMCYIIVMVALFVHSALARHTDYHRLLLSLLLVPLIRIISLSTPLAKIPQIWWYPIIYAPLLVAALQVIRLLGYHRREIGFQLERLPIQLVIALSGFVFGVLEYFILTQEAEATGPVLQENWLLSAFLLLVTTGFVEELIFRGVLPARSIASERAICTHSSTCRA
jgi:membrane protease YdiL (CAAX protease family)